ncbi:MAG: acyl-CoA thioesterase [Flavobacteriaceae bacterium]|nr:acyl-CoA thioesterase [Flavobacteriaceae bacterium]
MAHILSTTTKTRFQDCDPFNHLNNAKYLDYFLNAREDQVLEKYNLDMYKEATQNNLGWVVASHQISYLKPVKTSETLIIESQLISYDSSSIKLEMRMYNKDKSELKAFLWMHNIHISVNSGSIKRHSDYFMNLFMDAKMEIEENSFEKRIKTFLIYNKTNALTSKPTA